MATKKKAAQAAVPVKKAEAVKKAEVVKKAEAVIEPTSANASPNVAQPGDDGSLAQNDKPDLTRNQSSEESTDAKEKQDAIAGHWVSSKQDGFRRAGIAWSVTPTFIASGELTKQQIEILQCEPMLEVVEGEI